METNIPFFYFASIVLLSRLSIAFRDKAMLKQNFIFMALIQVMGLLAFSTDSGWIVVFAAALVGFNALQYYREKKSKNINQTRLVFLVATLILLKIIFSPWTAIHFRTIESNTAAVLTDYLLDIQQMTALPWETIWVTFFGLLLATGEANLLVRYIFHKFKLTPKTKPQRKKSFDTRDYNAGRVIGILERTLIFFLVLNGQYTAIGFIMAAKGFTRFKELEDREFAEYVLIGTLLSVLLAFTAATLVSWWLR